MRDTSSSFLPKILKIKIENLYTEALQQNPKEYIFTIIVLDFCLDSGSDDLAIILRRRTSSGEKDEKVKEILNESQEEKKT